MPVRINSNWRLDSFPTSPVSSSRSRVMIWEAFATESLGRPVARPGRRTLPGASAQRRLLVNGTQTTVLTRLRFKASPWTTTTGLRKPGPEPVGSGRLAQYTWPWATTIRRFQGFALPPRKWLDRVGCLYSRRPGSSLRLRPLDHGAPDIRPWLLRIAGSLISCGGATAAPLRRIPYRELRLQFSYPEYNQRTVGLQAVLMRADRGDQVKAGNRQ